MTTHTYRLPDTTIRTLTHDLTRGSSLIGYTLANGEVVTAVHCHDCDCSRGRTSLPVPSTTYPYGATLARVSASERDAIPSAPDASRTGVRRISVIR